MGYLKLNSKDHPAGSRLICRDDIVRPELYEVTVVEWSTEGRAKLGQVPNFIHWIDSDNFPEVVEILGGNVSHFDPSTGGPSGQPPRKKGMYIGAPACFALEEAIRHIAEAFGAYRGYSNDGDTRWGGGIYIVGSCLKRADWRDVDVRYIMHDDAFAELFPDAGQNWERDARWLLLTVSISERLSRLTGLLIDFQFQPQTHANEVHKGPRSAIGLRFNKLKVFNV